MARRQRPGADRGLTSEFVMTSFFKVPENLPRNVETIVKHAVFGEIASLRRTMLCLCSDQIVDKYDALRIKRGVLELWSMTSELFVDGHNSRGSKKRFVDFFSSFYPFDLDELDPPLEPRDAAELIYEKYRNPAEHRFSLYLANGKKFDIHSISSLTDEFALQRIEGLRDVRPETLSLIDRTSRPGTTILNVTHLYWGYLVALERFLNDKESVDRAEERLLAAEYIKKR